MGDGHVREISSSFFLVGARAFTARYSMGDKQICGFGGPDDWGMGGEQGPARQRFWHGTHGATEDSFSKCRKSGNGAEFFNADGLGGYRWVGGGWRYPTMHWKGRGCCCCCCCRRGRCWNEKKMILCEFGWRLCVHSEFWGLLGEICMGLSSGYFRPAYIPWVVGGVGGVCVPSLSLSSLLLWVGCVGGGMGDGHVGGSREKRRGRGGINRPKV